MVSTEALLSQLVAINDVKKFLEEHQQEFIKISPAEYLKSLAGKYKLSIAEIARNAKLGDYVYKIFNGERKASRDILIGLCIAMGTDLNEIQLLLRLSQYYIIDAKNERDAVILYGIEHGHSLIDIDTMLYELKMDVLIAEREK